MDGSRDDRIKNSWLSGWIDDSTIVGWLARWIGLGWMDGASMAFRVDGCVDLSD